MGNIIVIALLLFGAWRGWSDGFVRELAKLVGFFVGLFIAWKMYDSLGSSITMFIVICIAVPVLLGLAATVMTKALDFTIVGGISNRILGALIGAAKWWLLIICIRSIAEKVEQWKTLLENL